MQKVWNQYHLSEKLAKKYSHSTHLVSPIDQPERQMVLKTYASPLFRFPYEYDNFQQKVQRIKRLQNPHLASILDVGMEEGQPFVVREYLPNDSLRNHLRKIAPNRLELRDALTIVLQVGQALAYAHERNIVHGSVKPENIFLDVDGQPVLTDFSVVGRKDAIVRDQISEEYAFSYLAPEQFTGTSDARSDQYALGCLAYELITGRVPFVSQSLSSMMGQLSYAAPAPFSEDITNLIPSSLEVAIMKTLASGPDERFFDFSLFLDVIQSILLPLPAFPLLRSNYTRKEKTIPLPELSEKVENTSLPTLKSAGTAVLDPPQESENPLNIEDLFHFEDDTIEPEDAHLIADADAPEQTETVFSMASFASALKSPVFASWEPNVATKAARSLWMRGSFLRTTLLCVVIFVVIAGSLAGFWYSSTHTGAPPQNTGSVVGNHYSNAGVKGGITVASIGTTATATNGTSTNGTAAATATTSANASIPVPLPSVPDCLTGSPSSLNFTIKSQFYNATGYQVITLTNCGGDATDWSYSSQTNYPQVDLAPYPLSGSIALNASQRVQVVVVIPPNAQSGTYDGSITFTKGNANWTLSVTYTIR